MFAHGCVVVYMCTVGLLCVRQNPGKQGQEIQSSTAELIIGLVQLVPLANMGECSQEAMEVSPISFSPFFSIFLHLPQWLIDTPPVLFLL